MATVIVSMLTGIRVRRDIAMTGEITLRGRVLPIGGLKEKLLAALRGGIKKVLIPEDNVKDLAEIPNSVKTGLEIVPVSRMEEVLRHALVRSPTPIVSEEDVNAWPPPPRPRAGPGPRRPLREGWVRAFHVSKAPRIRRIRGVFVSDAPISCGNRIFFSPLPANPCVLWPKREQ